jgi:hypothetical protein
VLVVTADMIKLCWLTMGQVRLRGEHGDAGEVKWTRPCE